MTANRHTVITLFFLFVLGITAVVPKAGAYNPLFPDGSDRSVVVAPVVNAEEDQSVVCSLLNGNRSCALENGVMEVETQFGTFVVKKVIPAEGGIRKDTVTGPNGQVFDPNTPYSFEFVYELFLLGDDSGKPELVLRTANGVYQLRGSEFVRIPLLGEKIR